MNHGRLNARLCAYINYHDEFLRSFQPHKLKRCTKRIPHSTKRAGFYVCLREFNYYFNQRHVHGPAPIPAGVTRARIRHINTQRRITPLIFPHRVESGSPISESDSEIGSESDSRFRNRNPVPFRFRWSDMIRILKTLPNVIGSRVTIPPITRERKYLMDYKGIYLHFRAI